MIVSTRRALVIKRGKTRVYTIEAIQARFTSLHVPLGHLDRSFYLSNLTAVK